MSHFLDWRDYSRQPHIKQLIESKGLEFVRQQFLKESNRTLWNDPFIINENIAVGQSLSNNNSAAVGSSPSIIGNTAEVQLISWVSTLSSSFSGSLPAGTIQGNYFDITAYNGTVDYSYNHVNSSKTFRLLIVSQSGYTATNTTGLAGLITASYTPTETANVTGSLLSRFKDAINTQTSTAVVAGFTNSIAPSTLFTATLAVGSGSMTITHVNAGGVPDGFTTFNSSTSSITTVTEGNDKYYSSTGNYQNSIIFNGSVEPYTTLARKG